MINDTGPKITTMSKERISDPSSMSTVPLSQWRFHDQQPKKSQHSQNDTTIPVFNLHLQLIRYHNKTNL